MINRFIFCNPSTEAKPQPYYCNKICQYGPYYEESAHCANCCAELLDIVNDASGNGLARAQVFWDKITQHKN